MTLSKNITDNLASVFFNVYTDASDRENGMKLLRIFDFNYSHTESKLTYSTDEILRVYFPDTVEYTYVITPFEFGRTDLESVYVMLDSLSMFEAIKLSPLFDALGWVARIELDKVSIRFVGSDIYDLWNEPYESWDDDIEDTSEIDWFTGTDWADGWNLENLLPANWKDCIKEDFGNDCS